MRKNDRQTIVFKMDRRFIWCTMIKTKMAFCLKFCLQLTKAKRNNYFDFQITKNHPNRIITAAAYTKPFHVFNQLNDEKKTNANKLWCTDTFNCSIYFQAGKTGAMTEEATEYECGWLRNQRNIKKPFASGKRKQCFFSLSIFSSSFFVFVHCRQKRQRIWNKPMTIILEKAIKTTRNFHWKRHCHHRHHHHHQRSFFALFLLDFFFPFLHVVF